MLNLRPATPTDLDLLRHWDEQPHIIASDPNDDWGWEIELTRNPDWREQLIAEIEDRPIGFIQIIDPAREDSHYWGEIATTGGRLPQIFAPLIFGLGKRLTWAKAMAPK